MRYVANGSPPTNRPAAAGKAASPVPPIPHMTITSTGSGPRAAYPTLARPQQRQRAPSTAASLCISRVLLLLHPLTIVIHSPTNSPSSRKPSFCLSVSSLRPPASPLSLPIALPCRPGNHLLRLPPLVQLYFPNLDPPEPTEPKAEAVRHSSRSHPAPAGHQFDSARAVSHSVPVLARQLHPPQPHPQPRPARHLPLLLFFLSSLRVILPQGHLRGPASH